MTSRVWQWAALTVCCMASGLPAWAQDPNAGPGPGHSPLQSRDEVRQTQPPRPGYYQDIPRRPGDGRGWQAGGPGQRPGDGWGGRPGEPGDGWGPGPRYRPGQAIGQFPDRYWRVPYRGREYFFSGGYWYQPQGPGYVVVRPPFGARVGYLPPYAREVWAGGTLLYGVADAYYQYQPESGEYVVVDPAQVGQVSAGAEGQGNGYDVIAYPAQGQPPQQQEQDRYQCHRWAVEQPGFDPAGAGYAPPGDGAQVYRRALGACLSGRGYSVN
ncbi:hypothetical protein Q6A49_05380 [Pseudomonas sp. 22-AL-CL-001]|uniref:DUF6515 family protein n=1 Tax=Pseudomonas alabamensis TaxID=3064349 RepID=UPI002713D613|nr:DUF6515 family protein [Pseudomonas sp. 22-AL-CL-001]MDO7909963.1 hypothetical protein [Pseudomonas sp. 22-AL-CL-001]